MADQHAGENLPVTWPFRLAGTLGVAALAWFCLGFAAEDFDKHLDAFWEIFWGLTFALVALCIVGAAINALRDRRHSAA